MSMRPFETFPSLQTANVAPWARLLFPAECVGFGLPPLSGLWGDGGVFNGCLQVPPGSLFYWATSPGRSRCQHNRYSMLLFPWDMCLPMASFRWQVVDPPDAVKGGVGNCQRFVTDRPKFSPPILSRIFAGPMVVQVVGEGPGGKGRKRDVICLALFC